MPNVILYARVSTQKQSTQGESLDVQVSELHRYAKQNGWTVVGVFQEQFTGTKDSRPELDNAFEHIKQLKLQWIQVHYFLVYKIDRNTRWWVEVHFSIKSRLKVLGTALSDTQWIIQEERNVVHINGMNTTEYSWANINPSESSEIMMAMSAKHERNAILQRTISQEIRNSLEWYWTRESIFGYQNTLIFTEHWKKTIQIPDSKEAVWIRRIFEMKAQGYPDKQIAEEVNMMGYISRIQQLWDKSKTKPIGTKWGLPLSDKKIQEHIKNPIYAGISVITWKGNPTRVVKQKYEWLVSVELWNKANKGKRKISFVEGEIKILHWEELSEKPNRKKRNRNNPEYPFGKLITCDNHPDVFFFWNAPKGRNGTTYPYYSVKPPGKKRINVKQSHFEDIVIQFLSELEVDKTGWLNLYEKILKHLWEKRKMEIATTKEAKGEYLESLKDKRNTIIQSIVNISQYPTLLASANEQLEDINIEIQKVEEDLVWNKKLLNVEDLKSYWKKLIENLWKIASSTRDHDTLKLLFNFTFTRNPSYSEILSRNTPLRPMLALQNQQKILQYGGWDENTRWQPQ